MGGNSGIDTRTGRKPLPETGSPFSMGIMVAGLVIMLLGGEILRIKKKN